MNDLKRVIDLLKEEEVYFRVHGAWAGFENLPCFCSKHAVSTSDGMPPGAPCPACDGDGDINECIACGGTGKVQPKRGYSCFRTAEELLERFGDTDTTRDVVIFDGREVGTGVDGEPLVVPDGSVEVWTSLVELAKALREGQ